MNSIKCLVAAMVFGLASFCGASAATVRDIKTTTHYPWNGKVDVTYTVTNVEAGSSYTVSAIVRAGGTDYPALTANITADGTYSFTWDAANTVFVGRVEDAKVIFGVAEPNFAVINLETGKVSYLVDAPEYTDEYKTTKMVLKRLGANYVGVFEVTQKQYELVMGNNPAYFSKYAMPYPEAGAAVEAKRPVERLSYEGLTTTGGFFDKLQELSGLPLALPTVVEWQAAARGAMPAEKSYNIRYIDGAKTNYYHTLSTVAKNNTWLTDKSGNKTFRYGMTGKDVGNQSSDATKGTATVGTYEPNDSGIYDMHGNVSEWTRSTCTNEDLSVDGILCGGDYLSEAAGCAVNSVRYLKQADGREVYYTGFRVFGDAVKVDEGFVHKTTIESNPFALDVDSDGIRQVQVLDYGTSTNFYYFPVKSYIGGQWVDYPNVSNEWNTVPFKNPAMAWVPSHAGLNVATNIAGNVTNTASFFVEALDPVIKVDDVKCAYDGYPHKIKVTITGPSDYEIVYWCKDKEGQAEQSQARTNEIEFVDVKRDSDRTVLSYEVFYKVTSAFYATKIGSKKIKIEPRSLKNAIVTFGELTYNGKTQTNQVTALSIPGLVLPKERLPEPKEGRDFEVSGNVGLNAQGYVATVQGLGNYKEQVQVPWEIQPLDFGNIEVEGGTGTQEKKAAKINLLKHDFVYNGHPQTNYVISVSINGVDFDPTSGSFSNVTGNVQTEAGTYKVVVTGCKNFKGDLTNEWTIAKLPITNATVWLDAPLEYNGNCQTQNVTNVTVVAKGYTIKKSEPAIMADIVIPDYTNTVAASNYRVWGNTGTNASAKVGAYTIGVRTLKNSHNFCDNVFTNWFIGQRDITNAVFTADGVIYSREAKNPPVTAKDRADDGLKAIEPMITASTNKTEIADGTNDWTVVEYLDATEVSDKSCFVVTGTDNGNYRGTLTNQFTITRATITNVTVKAEYKSIPWDGTEKFIAPDCVTVWATNVTGALRADEYVTSGTTNATASGVYTVWVEPTTSDFTNSVPPASDTWEIVPGAPVLTWTTIAGATNVTGNAGTIVFGVSDLTVAALANCKGEELHIEFSGTNKWIAIRDNKFHITERTTITVYSTYKTKDGTVLTGEKTVVTLAPGQCADPEIFITPGAGCVNETNFNRNLTPVTIKPSTNVNGVAVGVYDPQQPTKPFWPAWESTTNEYRRLYYTLLDASTNVIEGAVDVDYANDGLKVSADALFVVAQMRDISNQYLDSIVKTQQLTRVIGDVATTVISIVTNSVGSRTVTISCETPNAMIYFTTNYAHRTAAEAIRPAGPMEVSRPAADTNATVRYTGPFDIWLAKDVSIDIKAIAYTNTPANDVSDFYARSEVADLKDVREWVIGDALGCPDQVFSNGWSQVDVPQVEDPNPGSASDWGKKDVPWYVTNGLANAAGEAMRSGPLANSNYHTSSMTTEVSGPGMIVFRWKANCEDDPTGETWDHGEFLIDGAVTNVWPSGKITTNKIDGVTGWIVVTNWLGYSNSKHVLTWRYIKDFAKHGEGIAEGEDGIFLDSFQFFPADSFGDVEVTVDPLVFTGKAQFPTNEPCASAVGGKTNYIHITVSDLIGGPYDLVEGKDFEVTGDPKTDVSDNCTLTLSAKPGSFFIQGTTNVTWEIKPLDLTGGVVRLDNTSLVYNGDPQTVTVTNLWASHYRDGLISVYGVQQTWEPKSDTQTTNDTYTLTVSGSQNLKGGVSTTWKITAKPFVDDIEVTVKPEAITYLENSPKVTVRDTARGVELTEGDDYTLAWPEDIVNVGEKTITVTGKGNYGGQSKEATYRITQRNISAGTITPTYTTVTYNGIPWRNDIKVKNDLGSNLVENVDYKYIGDPRTQTNAGTYTNKIEGIGNYWSTKEITWTIEQCNIQSATVTLVEPKPVYDGTPKTQGVASVMVGTLPVPDSEYEVSGNVETAVKTDGDYTLTVTAKQDSKNFTGSATKDWNLAPRSLENAAITSTNLVWNGEAEWAFTNTVFSRIIKKPATEQTNAFTVADGATQLELNKDYTIVGNSNVGTDAGSYMLTIEGKGNYANAISNKWIIAPTVPLVKPNNANPTTNEIYLISGQTRVSMGCDTDDWAVKYFFRTADGDVRKEGTMTPSKRKQWKGTASAVYVMDGSERLRVEAYTFVQNATNVASDHVFIDYRIGTNAWPMAVLAYTNNVPMVDGEGYPCTNEVGAVITNFFHNGQLVALTRGNIVVSNVAEGVYQAYTNSTAEIYTDGTLRYTIDGTEPTTESPAWIEGTRIAITNTTTVITKVFGDQFADSPCVTNIFVREQEQYAPPKVEYRKEGVAEWQVAANGDHVQFQVVGMPVRVTNTNTVAVLDATCRIWCQTNDVAAAFEYPVDGFAFSNTVKLVTWIADANGEYEKSASVTNFFEMDKQLSAPIIAFTNVTQVVEQDPKTFTNAWQWITITRAGNVFSKDTEGDIYFKTNGMSEFALYDKAPIKIWKNETFYAIAKGGPSGLADSDVTNVVFQQKMATIAAPTIAVNPTKTVKQVEFTITRNEGNIVYFTTDGTTEPIGLNPGEKKGFFFKDAVTNVVLDITEGATRTVKAIAYEEVADGIDYIGVSKIASCATNRASRIGDALRPGVEETPGSEPSTADLDATSDLDDGNTEWTDGKSFATNTCWVVDTNTAYTAGGKSMRSGCVREVATAETADGTNSVMTARVYGPGTFSFFWKASTEFEPGDSYEYYVYDYCELTVDGNVPSTDENALVRITKGETFIYGTNDWTEVVVTIAENGEGPQEHTITWNYVKDDEQWIEGLGCEIEDCVWVDEFIWDAKPMMDQCDVYVGELTYNQQPQKPTVTVTNRVTKLPLFEGTDYAVDVTAQTNASNDYTLVVKGLGKDYTGSNIVTWAIKPLSIDNAVVTLSGGQEYTRGTKDPDKGKDITQYAVVEHIRVGDLDLVQDTTWTLTEGTTNATQAGTYPITLSGDDNLTGSVSTNWVIAPHRLADNMIKIDSKGKTQIVYSGIGTNVSFHVQYGYSQAGLKRDEGYTVEPGTDIATNAGTYKVVIHAVEGDGKNFCGSATQEWMIAKFDLGKYPTDLVLTETNFVYNAKPWTTGVERVDAVHPYFGPVTFSNEAWWVSNNVQTAAGEYWAYLYPSNESNFAGGPISNRWTIGTYTAEVAVAFGSWPVYEGGAAELSPTITSVTTVPGGLELVAGRDYTIEYASKDLQNRKYALKGTLTIVGKGNFYGLNQDVDYEILPEQIENTKIDLTDWSYVYDGTEKVPDITMTLPNGKTVKMDQSPQKDGKKIGGWMILDGSTTNATIAGSYPISIAGYYDYTETHDTPYTGNIRGTTNVTWKILCCDMSNDVEIVQSAVSFVYNREEQKPVVTVTSKLSGVQFEEGKDYEIDWPTDCVNASNLTYYVRGIGSVTNKYEMHYAITPAEITEIKFQAQPGKPWVCTYDGDKHTPKVAFVKAGNLELTTDEYKLTNVGQINVGEYTSEVKSTSRNFSDPATLPSANWKITPKSIENSEVLVKVHPIVYNGKDQKLEDFIDDITVTVGNLTVHGVKFDGSIPHKDAETYNDAFVTATDPNFTGSHAVTWTIEPRDLTDATAIEWESDRLLWNGQAQTPVIKSVTVPAIEGYQEITFTGDTLAGLTVADVAEATEAGAYKSQLTGSGNFKNATAKYQTWEIVPKAPKITPNDGTGKYTKLTDYITVEINNDTDDQKWSIYYTTNDWVETRQYDVKGGKWDIEGHTVVEAYAVSCDGCVTGETARCEYFFGKQNKAPTIALTAKAGAEAGRTSPFKGTEVKGVEMLVVSGNEVVTNFYHTGAKVCLTRFGTWDQQTIDEEIEKATTDKGLCPLTDGTIWYTTNTLDNIVSPTNFDDGVSMEYKADQPDTWPTLTTNAVIVARVFGKDLESSVEVTNVFRRLWTTMPKPTINAASTTFHTNVIVSITTNRINILDWTYTNANQKIWITVGDKTPFLYTNAFELTWKDCTDEQVTVTAVSKYGDDYIDSEADTKTFTHEKKAFPMPTMTPRETFKHKGFTMAVTNTALEGVGGALMISINGGAYTSYGEAREWTYTLDATTTIRTYVAATAEAHDYYNSTTNEATYTYSPYTYNTPALTEKATFETATFDVTITRPDAPAGDDPAHTGVVSYKLDDGAWTTFTEDSKVITIAKTTTVTVKTVNPAGESDHVESGEVSVTYTRILKAKPTTYLEDLAGKPLFEKGTVDVPATNFYHTANLCISGVSIGDAYVWYKIGEDGKAVKHAGEKIEAKDSFTVIAWAQVGNDLIGPAVTNVYTRKWETLAMPKITLIDPLGDSGDEFWDTGDRIAITNDMEKVEGDTVAWSNTTVKISYAVYTNSNDTTTVPTNWATFVQGVTTNFFKADTNAVWAIVEADDYLPSTNAVSFIRQFSEIGEFTEDMVHFDSPETRYEVNVTFDKPFAANAIYYTYEITNDEADVSTPWGNEYDVTKSSARYEGAFKVAIKPRQTLIVKARAYWEDESSALVGVAETNFVSRGEVVVGKYTLPWTIADALDYPDPETPFTVSDTLAKKGNTNCVEDTVNFTTGGSSMVFTNLVDNETVTLETMVTGPGTVTFDWRTSCEQGQHGYNHDYLAFSVDGTEVARLDGETDWTNVTFKIDGAMGDVHFLQWSYKKDAAEKKGADCAWVDHFTWVGGLQASDITEDMQTWFQEYEPYQGYYDEFLAGKDLTNWKEALGMDSAVTGRSYWDCYVLGLDPDDWTTDFTVNAPVIEYKEDTEGKTVPWRVTISWTPCTKKGRTYTLVGKKTLIDADWTILTTLNATADDEEGGEISASLLNDANKDYQFFQLCVRMTK